MVFLANLAFNLHSGISMTTTNVCLMQNKKKPTGIPVSSGFFHNNGPNVTQILPQRS